MGDGLLSRWTERHAGSLPWNIKVGDRFVVKVPDMEAYHRRTFMKSEKSEPVTLRAIIPEGMGVRVTSVAESWNEVEFSTSDMCSVPDKERDITIRTGIGFFTSPDAFARAVGLGTKRPEVYYFRMDNLPGSPWKPYYVLPEDTDNEDVSFSSIAPDQMQYQAEHFNMDRGLLESRINDGSIRREMPQKVEQVMSVDPEKEFDKLIDQKERGEITPEQFNEKSKRLFGFKTTWFLRRAEFNLDEVAPKAFASYKRDRAMGLPHDKAMEHSMGNWSMTINMRRQMAGQENLTDAEIGMLKQRVEQMVASEGGGGSTGPQDWTIAHMMPEMEKTASALWRLHLAKAKSNPAYEKETAVIRENKKKPEAKKPHDFKPAKWTHPNGHPRCLICGDEERIGGRCNVEPTAQDFADFEKEMDEEFPGHKERREKKAAALGEMFERGEITHTDFSHRMAMNDETERLLIQYWAGKITQTDLDARLRRMRTSA